MKTITAKKPLYRWIIRFFLMTTLILCLIELSFLKYAPNLHEIYGATTGKLILAAIFLLTSYIAQAALLAFVGAVISFLAAWLIPKKSITWILAVILSTTLIVAQIIDTITFSLYRAHEITLSIEVMHAGAMHQVIPLSFKEMSLLVLIIVIVLLVQCAIAKLAWSRKKPKPLNKTTGWISVTLISCCLFSYGLMASIVSFPPPYLIDNAMNLLILKTSRLVPYYNELYDALMPVNNPYQRTIKIDNKTLSYQTKQPQLTMHYPLHPMHCLPRSPLPNILFIVIDTWRYDAMTKAISPNIYQFSKKTLRFNNHWSGGNCTQSGIFSLFYGLPANYWKATLDHQSPVLLRELVKNNYELLIDASATLKFPEFDKNVFLDVADQIIKTPGNTTIARDQLITQRFLHFLDHSKADHPFFGFVFYDAAHNYCDGGEKTHQTPFKPAIKECARFSLTNNSDPIRYLNRYHNAVHFVDREIGTLLNALKQHHLDKKTIIIITADHGEQFNDEKLGLWSHNSAYSPYQLHVPFMIYWPGKSPKQINYFTSHNDVTETVLSRVFHCENNARDYTVGSDLLKPHHLDHLIAGNYSNYANITPKRVTRFYKNGAYAIRSRNSLQIPYAQIDIKKTKAMNKVLNRYFKKETANPPGLRWPD